MTLLSEYPEKKRNLNLKIPRHFYEQIAFAKTKDICYNEIKKVIIVLLCTAHKTTLSSLIKGMQKFLTS